MYLTTGHRSITKYGREDGKWEIDLKLVPSWSDKTIKEIKRIKIRDKKYFQDKIDNKVSKNIYTVECDLPVQLAKLFDERKLGVKNTKPKRDDFKYVEYKRYSGEEHTWGHVKGGIYINMYEDAVEKWDKKWKEASSYENIKLGALTIDEGESHVVYTLTDTETETFGTWDEYLFKVPIDRDAFEGYFREIGTERNWDFVKKTFEMINSKIENAEPSTALKLANGIFGSTKKHFAKYKYPRKLNYKKFVEDMIKVVRNCRKTIVSIKTEESKLLSLNGLMRVFFWFAMQAEYRRSDRGYVSTLRMHSNWFWEVIVGNNETEPMIEDPSEIVYWTEAVERFEPTTLEGLREGEVLEKLKEMLKKNKGWKKRCGDFFGRGKTLQKPDTACKKFQELKF